MPPADAPGPERLLGSLAAFGGVLRGAGLDVGPARLADAVNGLDAVGLGDLDRLYWTLRQTLVGRADELAAFDRAFAEWFLGRMQGRVRTPGAEASAGQAVAGPSRGRHETGAAAAARKSGEAGWSPDELLRRKDFATLTEEELLRLRPLIAGLAAARPRRRARRLRRHPRGPALDLRRTVRSSLATSGDPAELAFRRRVERRRRLVVLCDVSGSMEPYTGPILLFVHALLRSGHGVEAFLFGTRLTRVTAELSRRDPDRALRDASARVVDWSGGTRIGSSLRAFNDGWGRRAPAHGAVVVIVSDGWEREDTAAVAREMSRLARHAYAVVWLNPLKGHPGYQPLAGGMRAALPYVDRFLPGNDFESLAELVDALAGIAARHAA